MLEFFWRQAPSICATTHQDYKGKAIALDNTYMDTTDSPYPLCCADGFQILDSQFMYSQDSQLMDSQEVENFEKGDPQGRPENGTILYNKANRLKPNGNTLPFKFSENTYASLDVIKQAATPSAVSPKVKLLLDQLISDFALISFKLGSLGSSLICIFYFFSIENLKHNVTFHHLGLRVRTCSKVH